MNKNNIIKSCDKKDYIQLNQKKITGVSKVSNEINKELNTLEKKITAVSKVSNEINKELNTLEKKINLDSKCFKRRNFNTEKEQHILSRVWRAKKNKDDEYYTKYKDIKKELDNYNLKNKVLGLPCDTEKSMFVKYCKDNNIRYISGTSFENFPYESVDIVITNPPFSKWRNFYQTIKHKDFIIIGHKMSSGCKEIFEDIKNNKLWWGFNNNRNLMFERPDGSEVMVTCSWYTNIKHEILNKPIQNYIKLSDNLYAMPPTALTYYDPSKYQIVAIWKSKVIEERRWMQKWIWKKIE